MALAIALPYLPPAAVLFGFAPLLLLFVLLGVVSVYVVATEGVKRWFMPSAA